MAESGSRSPWVWLGCGCAAVVGIGVVLIGTAAFFGIRTARTMADPEARHDKALTILSASAIPSGYETQIAIKVPFFAEIVVLEGDERQFIYMKGLRSKGDLEAAFEDEDSFDTQLRRAGLQIKRRQKILARDALRVGNVEVSYVLVDGKIQFDASRGRANIDFDASDLGPDSESFEPQLGAVILMRCSTEDEPGLGLWMGPRAGTDGEDTTADQAAVIEFIERFGFCTG